MHSMEDKMQDRFSTFTLLIDRLKRNIRKIKNEEMAEFDLKSPHVYCLYYLYRFEALTSKELAEICDEDKASVSRSLEYLEANGYISCTSETRKRYKSPFVLTEKGKEVASHMVNKVDVIIEAASEGLSEEDRSTMYRGLAVICDNLSRICDKYDE